MVDFDKLKENVKSLKGVHEGDRCFIAGNGPSLANTNLDLIAGEYSFGLNRVSLIYDKTKWRPTYFVLVNEIAAYSSPHMFEKEIMVNNDLGITCIVNEDFINPNKCRRHKQYEDLENIYFVKSVGDRNFPFHDDQWSYDPSNKVTKYGSCLMALVQIACYMGFKKIYLVGCDLGYKDLKDNVDINHFTKEYNYIEEKNMSIHNKIMIESHLLIKRMTRKIGVEIINATVGGDLNLYKRENFEET